MTVGEWLAEWTDLFPGKRSATTAQHDAYMLAPFIAKWGELPLAEVTPLLAQRWALENPGQVRYLRRPFDKAVLMRLIAENPWRLVELPKRVKPPRPVPTIEQIDAAVRRCRFDMDDLWWGEFADFCEVAAFTGARLGGLAGLTVADVDLAAGRMIVTEKGGKVRTVALASRARGAIFDALSRRPDPAGLVFRSPAGRKIDRGLVSRSWKAVRGDFDGPFHSLKHFAGTWLAEQGVDERDIAVQLGHTDAAGRPYTELVRRVYVHPDHEDALARIAERV